MHPTIIGITGGIGSGKSFFAHALAEKGFPVYDCDRAAKRIVEEDPAVRAAIIALLGEGAYCDGHYQTRYVSEKVFGSPQGAHAGIAPGAVRRKETLLDKLNAIIHPAVKADILRWANLHHEEKMVFVESAILFESGLNDICDKVVCVTAPESVRIARVMARDHLSEDAIRARMAQQLPETERQRRSDMVYVNTSPNIDLTTLLDLVRH